MDRPEPAPARLVPTELGGCILYPVSEAAARHGASVALETDDPDVAYADRSPRYEIPSQRDLFDRIAR